MGPATVGGKAPVSTWKEHPLRSGSACRLEPPTFAGSCFPSPVCPQESLLALAFCNQLWSGPRRRVCVVGGVVLLSGWLCLGWTPEHEGVTLHLDLAVGLWLCAALCVPQGI